MVAAPKQTIEEIHRHIGSHTDGSSSIDEGHEFKAALIQTGGNVSAAAKLCGRSRDNFYDQMKKHGIAKGYGRKRK